jgi:hypothetical protein
MTPHDFDFDFRKDRLQGRGLWGLIALAMLFTPEVVVIWKTVGLSVAVIDPGISYLISALHAGVAHVWG